MRTDGSANVEELNNEVEEDATNPHIFNSLNHLCDKCGAIVLSKDWNFELCMCNGCYLDRSRWGCLSCGVNIGLCTPPYQGDFLPVKDYCDKCLKRISRMRRQK